MIDFFRELSIIEVGVQKTHDAETIEAWQIIKEFVLDQLQIQQGPQSTKSMDVKKYLASRRKTIESSIAIEVLSGNTVKESNERTALQKLPQWNILYVKQLLIIAAHN